jgi:hypothetical protein
MQEETDELWDQLSVEVAALRELISQSWTGFQMTDLNMPYLDIFGATPEQIWTYAMEYGPQLKPKYESLGFFLKWTYKSYYFYADRIVTICRKLDEQPR